MNAILLVAAALALGSAILLLLLCLPGRPTRGENFVGFHLVTTPLALASAASMLLGLLVHGVAPAWFAVLAYTSLPGYVLALVVLPFACFERRRARLAKLLVCVAVVGSVLLAAGPHLAPWAAVAGAAVEVTYGGFTTLLVAGWGLRNRVRRWWPRRRVASGSDFESRQAVWQREQWQKLPPDALVAQLLGFVRSFDRDVQSQCVQRLEATPDLAARLDEVLRQPHDNDAPFYLVHHGAKVRTQVVGGVNAMLDRQLAEARERLRRSRDDERPFLGNFAGTLEAGVAVLQAGGDVRAALQRWVEFLLQVPSHQRLGKQLQGYLR